jgi:hypothetical protein
MSADVDYTLHQLTSNTFFGVVAMKSFLKVTAVLLAAELAAVAVNYVTGSHVGSWVFGGAVLWWALGIGS